MSEYRYHGEIKSVLECVENARDLGGYPLTDGGVTASGRVIRCEVPLSPTNADLEYLRDGGFSTVIDLRDEKTAEKLPHGLKNREGFKYYSCPVDAGSKPAEIVEEVPLNYMEITRDPAFHRAWKIFAHAEGGVLYNCTAGRDRTGTFSMILLTAAGVTPDAVMEDYTVTKEYNRIRFERIRVERPYINLDAVCPRTWYAEEFLRLFREAYGSAEEYFRRIGLNEDEITKIRTKLR